MIDKNTSLITVLMSSYNDPKLEFALESLKNQTYKNLEIIEKPSLIYILF